MFLAEEAGNSFEEKIMGILLLTGFSSKSSHKHYLVWLTRGASEKHHTFFTMHCTNTVDMDNIVPQPQLQLKGPG